MDQLYCVRCRRESLQRLEPLDNEVAFFECSACGRQYALRPGKELTYRWGHPISLALYELIFDPPTDAAALRAAESLQEGRTDDEVAALVKEIRLELNDPTQQVRDILDCRGTEEELREFLELVCQSVENALQSGRRHISQGAAHRPT
jgi:hypothetical protein